MRFIVFPHYFSFKLKIFFVNVIYFTLNKIWFINIAAIPTITTSIDENKTINTVLKILPVKVILKLINERATFISEARERN